MKTQEKRHYILKFRNEEGQFKTETLYARDSVLKGLVRESLISDYRKQGFNFVAEFDVTREAYYIAKIDNSVLDYLENEQNRVKVQNDFRECKINKAVYIETMRLIDDYKWTVLSKLHLQMDIASRKEYNITNELAFDLVNAYF